MTASLAGLAPIATQRGGDPTLLRDELLHVIGGAIANHPRSQQTRIGPSEIGSPCTRRLAHKLAGTQPVNTRGDGWKATIGTAVHAWLAEAFVLANAGTELRWLVEQRVNVGMIDGATLDGSTDLYDRVTATVVDWKITTRNKIRDYRLNGPGEQYRVQGHAYGLGWLARGVPVDTVAVYFLPRDGELSGGYWHAEPFDPELARRAVERVDALARAIRLVGAPTVVPAAPTAPAYCQWCPYYAPGSTELTRSCPGAPGRSERPDPILSLLPNGSTQQ